MNGGQCQFTNGIQECTCTSGWTGNVCQTYYNPSKYEALLLALNRIKQIQKIFFINKVVCNLNCLNNGLCQIFNGIPVCLCSSGFSGRLCENRN